MVSVTNFNGGDLKPKRKHAKTHVVTHAKPPTASRGRPPAEPRDRLALRVIGADVDA